MLTEQACDMCPPWSERVVHSGRDEHLDDGFATPSVHACVAECTVHVGKARRQDDAGGVMVLDHAAGPRAEARQLGERHIHAERPGAAAPSLHPTQEGGREHALGDKSGVEKLWVDVCGDHLGADHISAREHGARCPAFLDQNFPHRGISRDLHPET